MQIDIIHIDACPSWREAGVRVQAAVAAAGVDAESIRFRLVATAAQASAVPFAGSPTILVDGVDLFPSAEPTGELACRVYVSEGRMVGLPTVNELTAALRARKNDHAES